MDRTRISSNAAKFNEQITTMDDMMQAASTNAGCPAMTVAQCLNVLAGDATQFHIYRQAWHTPGTGLYPQYLNPLTKGSVDGKTGDVAVFIKTFRQFAKRPLDAIASSPNITSPLAETFHVVPLALHADPVHATAPITENCLATIISLGGGEMEFQCRTHHDTKRPSKADGADSIQVAFALISPTVTTPPQHIPANQDDGTNKEVFTKADFVFDVDPASVGFKIAAFTRWYKSTNPALSGPWSGPVIAIIGL